MSLQISTCIFSLEDMAALRALGQIIGSDIGKSFDRKDVVALRLLFTMRKCIVLSTMDLYAHMETSADQGVS
jgi:hypothetical protein